MKLFKKLFKKKEKKPLNIKSEWNDLTVGDLQRIKSIGALQLASDDEKNLRVAALLAGIEYEEMIQIPLDEVRTYMDNTQFLFEAPGKKRVKRQYVINGRKYRLLKNEMEMLTSQYIDFQAVYKDGFDKRPGELLSIMMVPEGHTYNDGYDKDQVIEDMYDMRVEEALGIVDFFMMRFVRLIVWTRMYYKWKMRVARLMAPKKDREMMKAAEIQLNLVMDELNSMFGWIVRER